MSFLLLIELLHCAYCAKIPGNDIAVPRKPIVSTPSVNTANPTSWPEAILPCVSCNAPLPELLFNQVELKACPQCGRQFQAEVFPAFFQPVLRGRSGDPILVEGEASCYYHPQKKAAVPCEGCGRFLCALCDCELHGKHFCPTCLEIGKQKGKIQKLENQRTLYDNIALALAVYPVALVFGIYFTCITAPMALFMSFRHWNKPSSIVRQNKVRYVLAIVLSLLELAGWVVLIYFLTTRTKNRG